MDIGGADGLIHISELAWEHVEDPGQVLEIGQEVEVIIIRLDPVANRIGLSLKRLQPSPWIEAAERIQPGLELDGVVSRQASSGLYVSVNYGIEGLVRISKSPQLPERGTCVQVRVIAFDPERERMSLELIQTEEVIPPVTVLEVEDDGR